MADRKIFHDSITPLAEAGVPDKNQDMNLIFSLNMDPALQKELEDKVASGQIVPPSELKQKYVPDQKNIDTLVNWLKTQGFTITKISPNGTAIFASAPVPTIEKALQVTMVSVIKNGLTYTAAKDAPSLPAEVSQIVHAIIGLQPYRHANTHRRAPEPLAVNTAETTKGYLVNQILKAYNADSLGVTGKGQTIAILINTFAADSDLTAFWTQNNIAANLNQIQKINVANANLPAPVDEETLDAEWASGIAPGATIRVYAAASLNFVDLDTALDAILDDVETIPGMRQLSISLGFGETFMGGPEGIAATGHQKFLRLAAAGVNVFVSSGDAGSNPDITGQLSVGPVQVEYAASDPSVIAVGGTTLVLAPDGSVASETAWAGGGGGKSIFFDRPSWQSGISDTPPTAAAISGASAPTTTSATITGSPGANPTGTGSTATNEAAATPATALTTGPSEPRPMRLVPDVSLAADPSDGANLVLNGKSIMIGGTSWAAPVWAGFCALINEARGNAGKPFLPFLNPLIYPLRGTAAFRDITAGSNGAYSAGAGYDMVTGIGVPNIAALIAALP
jgi:kumamolisin